jgi:hypothetical protein
MPEWLSAERECWSQMVEEQYDARNPDAIADSQRHLCRLHARRSGPGTAERAFHRSR